LSRPTTRSASTQRIWSNADAREGDEGGGGSAGVKLGVEGGEEALAQVAVRGGERGDAGPGADGGSQVSLASSA
jgi:hypothetical protein